MDLRPYGIDHILTKKTDFHKFNSTILAPAKITDSAPFGKAIQFLSGQYGIIQKLGKGGYASTYETIGPDFKIYAVKILIFNSREFKKNVINCIKECIINIILMEKSKNEPNGPYVPAFYEIGFDTRLNCAFIRTERMINTLDYIIQSKNKIQNNTLLPEYITQIATILQFFGTTLKFNHRDLKGDNIMYRMQRGKPEMKLIDFGFSCLEWKGLKIHGSLYFSELRTCFKKDRDLSQLLYSTVTHFTEYISDELKARIREILIANVGKSGVCDMLLGCNRVKEWKNTYDFLDKKNVFVEAGTPNIVIKEMERYSAGLPFEGVKCEEGKVKNAKTRRCKKIKVEKPCKEGKARDPITRRCKKIRIVRDL